MKAAENTILNLCQQVDDLKEEVVYWRTKYEEERKENAKMLNQNLASASMLNRSKKDWKTLEDLEEKAKKVITAEEAETLHKELLRTIRKSQKYT